MKLTLKHLKQHALACSLFRPLTLRGAFDRLGFVQADPIRSPARAQDLILRHRVKNYKEGDLEKHYAALGLEEDYLYAYGFMPKTTWQLLHPRLESKLGRIEKKILEIAASHKLLHPAQLESYLGRKRELNGWGGYSKATTRSLQALHHRGLLRIGGREKGIRLYEIAPKQIEQMEPAERLKRLVLLMASILAPLPEKSLRETLRHLGYAAPTLEGRHSAVKMLLESGDLASGVVDGMRYVWPAGRLMKEEAAERIRFLAPFDPLVWDRRRFEHFWEWPYRFEAYTPPAKRKLGYYAMPMLWRDSVIGWVNIARNAGELSVTAGFVKDRPTEASFKKEYEAEVERFRQFLDASKAIRPAAPPKALNPPPAGLESSKPTRRQWPKV